MTLQSSGSMTIADINTELGRASGAQLSTNDSDLLNMAGVGASGVITIPDDLYGRSYIGPLRETFTVTVNTGGGAFPSYGYQSSPSIGSITPATYRSLGLITGVSSENAVQSYDFRVAMNGVQSANILTAIYIVEDDLWLQDPSHFTSSVTVWTFLINNNGGPWGAGDVGNTKTLKFYGL